MVRFHIAALIFSALGISGCGVVDMPSRGSGSIAQDISYSEHALETWPGAPRYGYVIEDLRIDVPRDLRVSEANVYYPIADIVWRGDPYGDRHEQVARIFRDGFNQATQVLQGGPAVIAEVEVRRFHALTEKARYTVGGVHSVRFVLTLRDAETGAVLDGPRRIRADMRAAGGAKALAEDAAGYTQRVAVTRHIAGVLARKLALEGAQNIHGQQAAASPTDARLAMSTRDIGAVKANAPGISDRAPRRP
jgi:hypothetical protein